MNKDPFTFVKGQNAFYLQRTYNGSRKYKVRKTKIVSTKTDSLDAVYIKECAIKRVFLSCYSTYQKYNQWLWEAGFIGHTPTIGYEIFATQQEARYHLAQRIRRCNSSVFRRSRGVCEYE